VQNGAGYATAGYGWVHVPSNTVKACPGGAIFTGPSIPRYACAAGACCIFFIGCLQVAIRACALTTKTLTDPFRGPLQLIVKMQIAWIWIFMQLVRVGWELHLLMFSSSLHDYAVLLGLAK
jgi:hypothetical protein